MTRIVASTLLRDAGCQSLACSRLFMTQPLLIRTHLFRVLFRLVHQL